MYNIDQLRMFVETVNAGSFSACARKLGKVQSGISQGVANLEIDMNIRLFDRSTRKPSLTIEGKRLLPYARAILMQSHELGSVVDAIERKEEPLIRLAVDNALFVPKLSRIFCEFGTLFPATAIEVMSVIGADVLKKVETHKADLGVMFCDMSLGNKVDFGYIGNLPFYAVCGFQHPLAGTRSLKIADLLPYRQLIVRGYEGDTIQYFAQVSTAVWWANNYSAILQSVEQGIGWAYIPCYLVEELIQQKKICKLSLFFDHKTWNPPVDLITVKYQSKGPAFQWLCERIKDLLSVSQE